VSTTCLLSTWRDIKIGESLQSEQEYPAKSVGKQGEEFATAENIKSYQDSLSGI
jgi:hypothetical protein